MTVPYITNSRTTVLAKVKVHSNITNWPEMLPTGWAPDNVSLLLSPIKKKSVCAPHYRLTLPRSLTPSWGTNSSPEPVLRHSLPQVSVTDEWWCLATGFQRFFSGSCWRRSVLLWWWSLLHAMALAPYNRMDFTLELSSLIYIYSCEMIFLWSSGCSWAVELLLLLWHLHLLCLSAILPR